MKRAWLGLVAVLVVSGNLHAQRLGAQLNWGDDADLGVGVRLEAGVPNLLTSSGPLANTFVIGSFDYFFIDCDECTYWEINGNLAVPVAATGVDPYLGAGLNIARFSVDTPVGDVSDTEVGVNLLAGLRLPIGNLATFGEARLELGGGEQLVLTFGLLFGGNR